MRLKAFISAMALALVPVMAEAAPADAGVTMPPPPQGPYMSTDNPPGVARPHGSSGRFPPPGFDPMKPRMPAKASGAVKDKDGEKADAQNPSAPLNARRAPGQPWAGMQTPYGMPYGMRHGAPYGGMPYGTPFAMPHQQMQEGKPDGASQSRPQPPQRPDWAMPRPQRPDWAQNPPQRPDWAKPRPQRPDWAQNPPQRPDWAKPRQQRPNMAQQNPQQRLGWPPHPAQRQAWGPRVPSPSWPGYAPGYGRGYGQWYGPVYPGTRGNTAPWAGRPVQPGTR